MQQQHGRVKFVEKDKEPSKYTFLIILVDFYNKQSGTERISFTWVTGCGRRAYLRALSSLVFLEPSSWLAFLRARFEDLRSEI